MSERGEEPIPVEVVHESYHVPVTQELLADSADLGDAIQRLLMTPGPRSREEIEGARRQRREERAAERHQADVVEHVLVSRLLERLGWGRRYALHYVQPYCTCEVAPDSGWERCEHAIDLGIEVWH